MKRIYAFTLDNDDYPSKKFECDIRLIAYLMYDFIYNYDCEDNTALIINDKIKRNNIYEGPTSSEYYLEYNKYDDKFINFEPFIIDDKSFALTIDDECMSENILYELMEQALVLVNRKYRYRINSVEYLSKNINDETNRKKAVHHLRMILDGSLVEKKVNVKKKVLVSPLFKKSIELLYKK